MKKAKDYKYTIYRDYVKIKSVVESCVNTVQLDTANKWACNLVDKWHNYINNVSLGNTIELWKLIDSVCIVLNTSIDEKRKELSKTVIV